MNTDAVVYFCVLLIAAFTAAPAWRGLGDDTVRKKTRWFLTAVFIVSMIVAGGAFVCGAFVSAPWEPIVMG